MSGAIKKLSAILLISVITMMSGCVMHLELGEWLIIQTMGLDFEEGEYVVTAQYYTGQSGSGGESAGSSSPTIYTAVGKGASIAHAIQEAGFNAGRPLMLKEAQLFILGKGLRDRNLSDLLVTFTNEYESYPKISVAAAVGKASDILNVKYKDESATVHRLHRLLQSSEENGISPQSLLHTVMRDSMSKLGSAYLPLLEVQDDKSDSTDDGKVVKLVGGVLAKNNAYQSEINLAEASGILWLKNKADISALTIEHNDAPVMLNIYDLKTTMAPRVENGQIIMDIHSTSFIVYVEDQLSDKMLPDKNVIEEKAELAVIERIMGMLKKVVIEEGVDVIDLEETIRQKNYNLWKEVEDDWENTVKTLEFNVTSDVKLLRYALS